MFRKFELSSRKLKTAQQGSALVIGIFIITVMFLMAGGGPAAVWRMDQRPEG